MADFENAHMRGSTFRSVDLTGADLHRVHLKDSRWRAVDFSGADFRAVGLHNVRMRGIELANADIYGELLNVVINGVDVVPLIEAELNRRDPDRAKLKPTDVVGFREAWDVIERRWQQTNERAARLRPELLHESVDGEWSFTQTLRHLVFATESWVHRAVVGDPAPWDPLSLPWDEMPDMPGVPRDRDARPPLDVVLALRRDRMATVRRVIDDLTETTLAADSVPVDAPGWPPPRSYPVRECLLIVLSEEWEHRLYAERDLAVLEARRP